MRRAPAAAFAGYRGFLSLDGARSVVASVAVGRLPMGMVPLAVLLLVEDVTHDVGLAALVVGANGIASALATPVQGAVIDRVGQWPVLLVCAVGSAVALAALVPLTDAGAPGVTLLAAGAVAGALMPPVSACARTLWSMIAEGSEARAAAYALDSTTSQLTFIVGPLLVAATITVGSVHLAVLVTAGLALVGTASFASCSWSRGWRPVPQRGRAAALHSRGVRVLVGSVVLCDVGWGAIVVVGLPSLAVHAGSPSTAGLLVAACGLGAIVGGIAYGACGLGRAGGAALSRTLLAGAILAVPLIAASSIQQALLFSVVAGLGVVPVMIAVNSGVAAIAPPGAVTESYAWLAAAMYCGTAIGSAIAGQLVDAAGVRAGLAVGVGGLLLAAGVAAAGRRVLR